LTKNQGVFRLKILEAVGFEEAKGTKNRITELLSVGAGTNTREEG
jgi:hypothetical protein